MRFVLGKKARTWAVENIERNAVLDKFEENLFEGLVNSRAIPP